MNMGPLSRFHWLFPAVALLASPIVVADRIPYARSVDLEVLGKNIIVRHHHDWSKVAGARSIRYSLAEPFGVGNDYSHISAYSRPDGAPLWRVPGPPLSWLGISSDGRYLIGLSNIKHWNITQLAVFAPSGKLIGRAAVSSDSCVPPAARNAAIASQPEEQRRLWAAFSAPACLPNVSNFSESVTNHIYWYHPNDPAPQVIEESGRVVAVELRDPKGESLRVPLDEE